MATELQTWATEQTAKTEKSAMQLKAEQAILNNLREKGEAYLRFKDGRKIYIDTLNAGGFQVSDFKVKGTCWDRDWNGKRPLLVLDAQQTFETAEEAAAYTASRI